MKKIIFVFLVLGCLNFLGCSASKISSKLQVTDQSSVKNIDAQNPNYINFDREDPCDGIKDCKLIICAQEPNSDECSFLPDTERQIRRVVVYESIGCTYTEIITGGTRGLGTRICPIEVK